MAHPSFYDTYRPRIWSPEGYRNIRYGDFISFTSENHCRYFERLWYEDDPQGVVTDGRFHRGQSLRAWLSKDLRRSVYKVNESGEMTESDELDQGYRRAPKGGFRLLFGACEDRGKRDYTRVPLPEKEFLELKTTLGIPEEFDRAIAEPSMQSSRFSKEPPLAEHSHEKLSIGDNVTEQEDSGATLVTCFIFKLGIHATGFYNLAISYNHSTNITHGIVLAQTEGNLNQLAKVAASMRDAETRFQQPLLPVVFIAELVVRTCIRKIYQTDYRLHELENDLGQHTWMDRPRGDPLKQDFQATTRSLNSSGSILGITNMRLEGLLLALDYIRQHSPNVGDFKGVTDRRVEAQATNTLLTQRVDYLSDLCRNMLFQAKYEQQRVQTLLAVVYNHMAFSAADVNNQIAADSRTVAIASKEDSAAMKRIAEGNQEDSKTMKEIAIATKKDGTAMKTIALLTMFFLPGTFIAAFFAMPLFNWDAPTGESVLKDRFIYYWAFTLPLTFAVLLLWVLCMLLPWEKWWVRYKKGTGIGAGVEKRSA